MDLRIGTRIVGRGQPLFVIAELGINHEGSLDTALALVDAAADAGASAVKLQTIVADRLVTAECPAPAHVAAASLRDFFRRFELDEAAHRAVAERAHSRGLAMMSTPFCEQAIPMLARVGCDALKIASGDLTHHHLIGCAARSGLPLVMSTGMCDMAEVGEAVACARAAGATGLALLHCVSAYPVPTGSENLAAITELAEAFPFPIGLSDHSTEPLAGPLAVALGASLYERHFLISRAAGQADAAVSSTPDELSILIATIRRVRAALGHGRKTCLPVERVNREASRRGLYAARPLRAGDVVDDEALVALRPATALDARHWAALVGSRLARAVDAGAPFLPSDITGNRTQDS